MKKQIIAKNAKKMWKTVRKYAEKLRKNAKSPNEQNMRGIYAIFENAEICSKNAIA